MPVLPQLRPSPGATLSGREPPTAATAAPSTHGKPQVEDKMKVAEEKKPQEDVPEQKDSSTFVPIQKRIRFVEPPKDNTQNIPTEESSEEESESSTEEKPAPHTVAPVKDSSEGSEESSEETEPPIKKVIKKQDSFEEVTEESDEQIQTEVKKVELSVHQEVPKSLKPPPVSKDVARETSRVESSSSEEATTSEEEVPQVTVKYTSLTESPPAQHRISEDSQDSPKKGIRNTETSVKKDVLEDESSLATTTSMPDRSNDEILIDSEKSSRSIPRKSIKKKQRIFKKVPDQNAVYVPLHTSSEEEVSLEEEISQSNDSVESSRIEQEYNEAPNEYKILVPLHPDKKHKEEECTLQKLNDEVIITNKPSVATAAFSALFGAFSPLATHDQIVTDTEVQPETESNVAEEEAKKTVKKKPRIFKKVPNQNAVFVPLHSSSEDEKSIEESEAKSSDQGSTEAPNEYKILVPIHGDENSIERSNGEDIVVVDQPSVATAAFTALFGAFSPLSRNVEEKADNNLDVDEGDGLMHNVPESPSSSRCDPTVENAQSTVKTIKKERVFLKVPNQNAVFVPLHGSSDEEDANNIPLSAENPVDFRERAESVPEVTQIQTIQKIYAGAPNEYSVFVPLHATPEEQVITSNELEQTQPEKPLKHEDVNVLKGQNTNLQSKNNEQNNDDDDGLTKEKETTASHERGIINKKTEGTLKDKKEIVPTNEAEADKEVDIIVDQPSVATAAFSAIFSSFSPLARNEQGLHSEEIIEQENKEKIPMKKKQRIFKKVPNQNAVYVPLHSSSEEEKSDKEEKDLSVVSSTDQHIEDHTEAPNEYKILVPLRPDKDELHENEEECTLEKLGDEVVITNKPSVATAAFSALFGAFSPLSKKEEVTSDSVEQPTEKSNYEENIIKKPIKKKERIFKKVPNQNAVFVPLHSSSEDNLSDDGEIVTELSATNSQSNSEAGSTEAPNEYKILIPLQTEEKDNQKNEEECTLEKLNDEVVITNKPSVATAAFSALFGAFSPLSSHEEAQKDSSQAMGGDETESDHKETVKKKPQIFKKVPNENAVFVPLHGSTEEENSVDEEVIEQLSATIASSKVEPECREVSNERKVLVPNEPVAYETPKREEECTLEKLDDEIIITNKPSIATAAFSALFGAFSPLGTSDQAKSDVNDLREGNDVEEEYKKPIKKKQRIFKKVPNENAVFVPLHSSEEENSGGEDVCFEITDPNVSLKLEQEITEAPNEYKILVPLHPDKYELQKDKDECILRKVDDEVVITTKPAVATAAFSALLGALSGLGSTENMRANNNDQTEENEFREKHVKKKQRIFKKVPNQNAVYVPLHSSTEDENSLEEQTNDNPIETDSFPAIEQEHIEAPNEYKILVPLHAEEDELQVNKDSVSKNQDECFLEKIDDEKVLTNKPAVATAAFSALFGAFSGLGSTENMKIDDNGEEVSTEKKPKKRKQRIFKKVPNQDAVFVPLHSSEDEKSEEENSDQRDVIKDSSSVEALDAPNNYKILVSLHPDKNEVQEKDDECVLQKINDETVITNKPTVATAAFSALFGAFTPLGSSEAAKEKGEEETSLDNEKVKTKEQKQRIFKKVPNENAFYVPLHGSIDDEKSDEITNICDKTTETNALSSDALLEASKEKESIADKDINETSKPQKKENVLISQPSVATAAFTALFSATFSPDDKAGNEKTAQKTKKQEDESKEPTEKEEPLNQEVQDKEKDKKEEPTAQKKDIKKSILKSSKVEEVQKVTAKITEINTVRREGQNDKSPDQDRPVPKKRRPKSISGDRQTKEKELTSPAQETPAAINEKKTQANMADVVLQALSKKEKLAPTKSSLQTQAQEESISGDHEYEPIQAPRAASQPDVRLPHPVEVTVKREEEEDKYEVVRPQEAPPIQEVTPTLQAEGGYEVVEEPKKEQRRFIKIPNEDAIIVPLHGSSDEEINPDRYENPSLMLSDNDIERFPREMPTIKKQSQEEEGSTDQPDMPHESTIQERLRTQADRFTTKLKGISKPKITIHKPKIKLPERPNIKMPEIPKIKLPDRHKFSLPDKSKFHLPERPKFNFPDTSKFHFPEKPKFFTERPRFKLPDRPKFGQEKKPKAPRGKKPNPSSLRRPLRDVVTISSQSTPGSTHNIFETLKFKTYPRFFKKKKTPAVQKMSSLETESSQPSTPPARPRSYPGQSQDTAWVHAYRDLKFADEESNLRVERMEEEYERDENTVPFHENYDGGVTNMVEREFKQSKADSMISVASEKGSSGSSSNRRRAGVIEEIDSDEFFLREKGLSREDVDVSRYLSLEIRDAFRQPKNALASLNNELYDDEEPDIKFEHIPRAPQRNKLQKSASDDREKEFHTFPKRPSRRKESDPEIVVKPPRRFRSKSGSAGRYRSRQSSMPSLNTELDAGAVPEAPRRKSRERSIKSLTREGRISDLGQDNVQTHITAQHSGEIPPVAPLRKSRSRGTSLADDDRTSRGADSTILPVDEDEIQHTHHAERVEIDEEMMMDDDIELEQEEELAEEEDDRYKSIEPARTQELLQVEERSVDLSGYAVVSKERKKPPRPPPPPPHQPFHFQSQLDTIKATGKNIFFTYPRRAIKSLHKPLPTRPIRNYSTLGPVRPPRRNRVFRKPVYMTGESPALQEAFLDKERDLQSGEVVMRMKGRPLPAPPRPPRKNKEEDTTETFPTETVIAPEEIEVEEEEIEEEEEMEVKAEPEPKETRKSYLQSKKDEFLSYLTEMKKKDKAKSEAPDFGEVSVSIQTDPLPKDVIVIDQEIEETQEILILPDSLTSQGSSKPRTPLEVKREIQTREEPETETNIFQQALERVEAARGVLKEARERVIPGSTSSLDERRAFEESPMTRVSQRESLPTSLRSEDIEKEGTPPPLPSRPLYTKPIPVSFPDKLHLTELDVDKLNVSEIQANKITVSEIESACIDVTELTSRGGNLTLNGIELPPDFISNVVAQVTSQVSQQVSQVAQQVSQVAQQIQSQQAQAVPRSREVTPQRQLRRVLTPPPSIFVQATAESVPLPEPKVPQVEVTEHIPQPRTTKSRGRKTPSRVIDDSEDELATTMEKREKEQTPTLLEKKEKEKAEKKEKEQAAALTEREYVLKKKAEPQISTSQDPLSPTLRQASSFQLIGRLFSIWQSNVVQGAGAFAQGVNALFPEEGEKRRDAQIAAVILLILITGLILIGFGFDNSVHHHHWDYLPPR